MRRRRRSGFTFAELMFAFTIIVVLAAILFPVFARAREKAYQTSCAMNLRNIGMAMRIYSAEQFGHFPPTDNDLWPLIPKYLPEREALICPTVSAVGRRFPEQTLPGRVGDPPDKLCDYVYKGGFADDERPSTVVVGDEECDRHNHGGNHLFLDGHVKWLRGPEHGDAKHVLGYEDLDALRPPGASWRERQQQMPPFPGGPPGYQEPPPPQEGAR